MTKNLITGAAQSVVNSVQRATEFLKGREAPKPRAKLATRRGYGSDRADDAALPSDSDRPKA